MLLPNNTWYYSGAVARPPAIGLQAVNGAVPSAFAGQYAGGDAYAWRAELGKGQFSEVLFTTSQATVTPEPATMTLLGSDWRDSAASGARRRRKA